MSRRKNTWTQHMENMLNETRLSPSSSLPYDPARHYHTKHDGSWWEYDARGIPIARVCAGCREEKLKGYRPEVLTDASYEADEPIEGEDY